MEERTYIIAELSANHNNDFELAKKTIHSIKESGANAVKFQTFTAESLTLNINNEYFGSLKKGLWKGKNPWDLFSEAAMPWEWQKELSQYAISIGLEWLSSPFDFKAVDFLESINIPAYKIASLEITDIPLIEYIASKRKPIIISTGAASIEDIKLALDTCRNQDNNEISLLKCTSQYPAPIEAANLKTIPDMKKRFGVKIGLSDHSPGSIVPIVATSLGAEIIEKHFILDRSIGGPDSSFSMEPDEFKQMVEDVRNAEKSLGEIDYTVSPQDKLRRRSLFVVKDIRKGDVFTEKNVKSIRPGHGIHPKYLKKIIGNKAAKDIPKGTPLKQDDIKN
ncbi:MAG: pseudaminic acid synthase [Bacteroidota bacterium]